MIVKIVAKDGEELQQKVNAILNVYKTTIQEETTKGISLNRGYQTGIRQWFSSDFREFTNSVFEREGDVGGHPKWSPNRGSYAEWKRIKYPDAKILELTGKLKLSFLSNWKLNFNTSDTTLTLSAPSYATYHQKGIPPLNWKGNLGFLKREWFFETQAVVKGCIKSGLNGFRRSLINEIIKKARTL